MLSRKRTLFITLSLIIGISLAFFILATNFQKNIVGTEAVQSGTESGTGSPYPVLATPNSYSRLQAYPYPVATVAGENTLSVGIDLYRGGYYEEAMTVFEELIRKGVNLAEAYGGKGAVHIAWRDYEEALNSYTIALSYSRTSELLTGQCNAFRLLQRVNEAISSCNQAIELDVSNPEPYLVLAKLYLDKGDTENARLFASKVFNEMSSNRDQAAFILGLTALQEGKGEEAINNFTKAIELNPKEPVYYWERGFLALGLGKFDLARSDMRAILQVANPRLHGELMFRANAQLQFLNSNEESNP
jgi:tetratricopeptide (TPR) repeat protein